jgi:hypothetical protein
MTALSFFEGIDLPDLLPDETLFSWASRYHLLACHPLSTTTSALLFGHCRAGLCHDLPGGLDYLVAHTGEKLGSVETILQERTIAPSLLTFQTRERVSELIHQLGASSVGSLKYRLGLLTSQFRANFPLKACPVCMADNLKNYQVAYWHRAHQLPGVWICLEHCAPLLEAQCKTNGVNRFGWLLPAAAKLGRPLDSTGQPVTAIANDALHRLARCAQVLAGRSMREVLEPASVVRTHTMALIKAGYATRTGKPKLSLAARDYLSHCDQLRIVPELAGLPATLACATQHLRRLLCLNRFVRHPIHQLTMISWLYPTPDAFLVNLNAADTGPCPLGETVGSSSREPAVIDPGLMFRLSTGTVSARAAAKLAGVDIKTLMVKAASQGIEIKRRPKKIKTDRYAAIVDDLSSGLDKTMVASQYDISINTVTTILRTYSGLQSRWHAIRQQRAQKAARNSWQAVRDTNPGLATKALRLIEPAAYAWLYRHDRDWLRSHAVSPRVTRLGRRVDWDARDAELAQIVRQAALEIFKASPNMRRIGLQALYQRLPALRVRLSALVRLPLTRRVIEQITQAQLPAGSPALLEDQLD